MKIGILSQDIRLYSTKRLYDTAIKRGHDTEVVSYLRCYMNIAKAKPRIFSAGRELNYDSVIPRIAATWTFYGAAVVRQFELMGSVSANSSAGISRSRDKLRALQLIGNTGVEMPITGYVHFSRDVERRPYIKTDILMDGITKNIELTLTDRGPMDYTMLIGRKALGRRWIVNPSISFMTRPNGNKK